MTNSPPKPGEGLLKTSKPCSCGHVHPLMTQEGLCVFPKVCGCTNDPEIRDLMNLELEYRLTIAHRIDCACAPYLVRRRLVLMKEVLKLAREQGVDPPQFFHDFAQRLHTKLCIDQELPNIAEWKREVDSGKQ